MPDQTPVDQRREESEKARRALAGLGINTESIRRDLGDFQRRTTTVIREQPATVGEAATPIDPLVRQSQTQILPARPFSEPQAAGRGGGAPQEGATIDDLIFVINGTGYSDCTVQGTLGPEIT